MKNTKIIIKTKTKTYPIYIGDKNINSIDQLIKKKLPKIKKICLIADKRVPQVILKKLKKKLKKYNLKVCKLHVNEKLKNFKVAYKLIEFLIKENFNKSDCVIALGGGVLGDLSAFVSSLTKRGVKFINIPTTLLAQVDSSIGGKTAVNSDQGKNLIGTFYQPDFVLIDISVLNSLPQREMICGYGEVLKHSLILDRKFFFWLTKNARKIISKKNKKVLKIAITKSCRIKSFVVARDENEKNLRMILNFGHTFAHGFESATKFSRKLNHGEAVLLGMMMASKLSYKKSILPLKDLSLIKKHYHDLNLPVEINKFFRKNDVSKIISFMKKDKKNFGTKINLILLKKIGKTIKSNNSVTDDEIKKLFYLNF